MDHRSGRQHLAGVWLFVFLLSHPQSRLTATVLECDQAILGNVNEWFCVISCQTAANTLLEPLLSHACDQVVLCDQ